MSSPLRLSLPAHTTSRYRILTANVYVSTFQFIAALLLLLMLLWHISTITIIKNYEMPYWWVKSFLVLHECERTDQVMGTEEKDSLMGSNDDMPESVDSQHRDHESCHTQLSSAVQATFYKANAEAVSVPCALPYTYHPFLRPRFLPSTQNVLLSIFDFLMVVVLASHTVTYFVGLPTAIALCDPSEIRDLAEQKLGEDQIPSMEDRILLGERCVGLNVDIHVAGGFAVFMALVLGLLHLAALAVRLWEWIQLGRQDVVKTTDMGEGQKTGGSDQDERRNALSLKTSTSHQASSTGYRESTLHTGTTSPAGTHRNDISIGPEERSIGVVSVNWGVDGTEEMVRRRTARTERSEDSTVGSRWDEVFLECLVDA
ncbi:hypothetical protein C7974DRAFT_470152 [Boeremia exigua]|uniref:uncharacterized protein n=1 Tax=Boeremia exigua TaxID=749465 RepID=UPI001E8D3ADD|nr:uncharacterized protein C7974DRAFT_470152 [Boeremia exigua]KAH6639682.1 hypothetical protein C7974DRAFT_470152 [Boeremia exigua]